MPPERGTSGPGKLSPPATGNNSTTLPYPRSVNRDIKLPSTLFGWISGTPLIPDAFSYSPGTWKGVRVIKTPPGPARSKQPSRASAERKCSLRGDQG